MHTLHLVASHLIEIKYNFNSAFEIIKNRKKFMYDLIIIGGGPGGVAAGVYAARKR